MSTRPTGRAVLDKAMTEAELQSAVIAHLKAFGYRYYHTRYSFGSNAGFPDLVAVRPCREKQHGRLAFIELKREGKWLTDSQQAWHDDLFSVGIEGSFGCGESDRCEGLRFDVVVWQPSDLSSCEIERVLRGALVDSER